MEDAGDCHQLSSGLATASPGGHDYPTAVRQILTRARAWDFLRRGQGVTRLERRIDALEERLRAGLPQPGGQAERDADAALDDRLAQLSAQLDRIDWRIWGLDGYVRQEVRGVLTAIAGVDQDKHPVRSHPSYEIPFTEPEPLVSIVIPTVGRPDTLREVALPSILGQSYERLEVIVVGDHVSPLTERAIASIGDQRVRFHNLSQRFSPRRERVKQWWGVADAMPRNEGYRLARGHWIGTSDDDDEMRPGAIERLLAAAREHRAELAYGRFHLDNEHGGEDVGDFPPRAGRFGFATSLRHRAISFFELQLFAADLGEVGDAVMLEAMLRVGVRFAMIPDVIFDYHPSMSRQP